MAAKISKFWISVIAALVVIIILGSVLAWSKYNKAASIEISLVEAPAQAGSVYIGEGVVAPGTYPFSSTDTIADLLAAAGGITSGSDPSQLRLDIPLAAVGQQPQRININRAEPWLLEALPGIGEVLAKRIVDYRQQNGPFQTTSELTKVAGIGTDLYDKIKGLITVAEP